jgi:hypothetical protein
MTGLGLIFAFCGIVGAAAAASRSVSNNNPKVLWAGKGRDGSVVFL